MKRMAIGVEMDGPIAGVDALFEVETTKPTTASRESKKWPVQLRTDCSIDPARTWIFTDGSGSGWHAAVIVRPGIEERRVTAFHDRACRNVGAELDGILLGLKHTIPGESVVIVSDYLWSAYYVNGWWKVTNAALCTGVAAARALIEEHRLIGTLFIHHPGHQSDRSDFSQWNKVADRLCKKQLLLDSCMSHPPEDPAGQRSC